MDKVICCVIDSNTTIQATAVRRTKIIATIGPACTSEDVLRSMIRCGMNCARLNFSHGTREEHQQTFNKIRSISQQENIPIAILQDLQGPKIRTTELAQPLQLEKDQCIIISTDPTVIGTIDKIGTTYTALAFDAKPGHVLLLDDGMLQMTVLSQRLLDSQHASIGDELVCRVDVGGVLRSHKGINLPGTPISAPSLTEKDIEDLQFGLTLGVDYLAMSFVRTGADITNAKSLMHQLAGFSIPIISKIERIEALSNIDDIITQSFGIMVARGDLGVELDMTDLPILQKQLIQKASKVGKLDITATQMLTSMMENTIPTRAEISDVANAIFDGTDVIMMSNETAVGKFPLLALQMMGKIAANADKYYQTFGREEMFDVSEDAAEISSIAAALIAKKKHNIKAIVTITNDGVLPLVLSQSKPVQPVLAITKSRNLYNAMALYYGVRSILVSFAEYDKLDATCNVPAVLRELLVTGNKMLSEGDTIVYLQSLQHEHVVRLAEL